MRKFLMPLNEYNRIHRVAHGVLQGVPDASPEKACLFFASVGGFVLNQIYGINAAVVAGAFGLCLGSPEDVAFFGRLEDSQLVSDRNAFHMWLQTDTHIIDFMAPIYREAFSEHPKAKDLSRLMFQRRLNEEAGSLDDLKSMGDFRYFPDPALTDELLDGFLGRAVTKDLLRIAIAWYGKRTGRQSENFAMSDESGRPTQLSLAKTGAIGSW
jgi:hypothetical protein